MTKPALNEMTEEDHANYVKAGCDPHCHVCGYKIVVGDWYGLKKFVEAGDIALPVGVLISSIRGTCCEPCVKTDRYLSDAERENLMKRVTAAMTPKYVSEIEPRAPRQGAYVLDDGTVIP